MEPALIDTDILSLYMRGDPRVVARFQEYSREYEQVNFSLLTYYEIVSGLKHRDARKQLATFLEFAEQNAVVPITIESVSSSADM
jgi:tRNA(fMet)-specific endonuclease VapC